jgi:hypothetical protein
VRGAWAVPVAAAVVLTGCTGTPPADPAPAVSTPTPSASVPAGGPGSGHEWAATRTQGAAPVTSPPASTGVRLAPVGRVALPTRMRVAGLALAGSRIAWSGCAPCAGAAQDATDVYVADLPAGRPRPVARTRFRWGSTAVVGFSGHVLVWLDGADLRDGGVPHTRWALRALDLRTGTGWTIASGGNPGDPAQTPVAFVSAGRVAWQLFDLASARGPVRVADLRTREVRTVNRALPGLLRGTASGALVHTANDPSVPTVVPDAPVPVDAYLTPAAGGPPSALTSGHDLADAAVGGGRLLWSTHHGDGETLWSVPLTGGPPTRLFTGPVLTFAAGRGFGAWTTRETEPVVQVGAGGRAVTLPDVPAAGGALAVDGDRLAILTVPSREATAPVTISLTRVLPRA